MSHTKGKWSFKQAPNGDCGIYAEGTGIFAECFADIRHSGENNSAEARENARLVCAAGPMLDLIRSIASGASDNSELECRKFIAGNGFHA